MQRTKFVFVVVTLIVAAVVVPIRMAKGNVQAIRLVTNVADSGSGSLREALGLSGSGDTIRFLTSIFLPNNPQQINLLTELPTISFNNFSIDASDAGVILNGSGMPYLDNDCLRVQNASGVTIQGIQFVACRDHGIEVVNPVSDLTIGGKRNIGTAPLGQGNRFAQNKAGVYLTGPNIRRVRIVGNNFGTNLSGNLADSNSDLGLVVLESQDVTIGGSDLNERNLISGNGRNGMEIWRTQNITVEGNYVGTNYAGNSALLNGDSGVLIVESSNILLKNNLLSGNKFNGAFLELATNARVIGNWIGVDATGSFAIGNGDQGVGQGIGLKKGQNLIIGGSGVGEGNLISGNRGWTGLSVEGLNVSGSWVTIQGNYIGTDLLGSKAIPNLGNGIYITGTNALIGGDPPSARNLISGNRVHGVHVDGFTPLDTTLVNNYIGTDATGMNNLGNGDNGFISTNVGLAIIKKNVISGNGGKWAGLGLEGMPGTGARAEITGNTIGLSVDAEKVISNTGQGMALVNLTAVVGGPNSLDANVVGGNLGNGIYFEGIRSPTSTLSVVGNYIGTNRLGTRTLGNAFSGLNANNFQMAFVRSNIVGGNNFWAGLALHGLSNASSYAVIQANRIGIDTTGSGSIANQKNGIFVTSTHVLIGGGASSDGNLIGGNGANGIELDAATNSVYTATIQNNLIGTDIQGRIAFSNTNNGVVIRRLRSVQVISNVVSSSGDIGVILEGYGTMSARICGNKIGTDITGKLRLGNHSAGIHSLSTHLVIGQPSTGCNGNLVSGNGVSGISMYGRGTTATIQGNTIGLDSAATYAIANNSEGIWSEGPTVTLGGAADLEANIIAGNKHHGVVISDGTSSLIKNNFFGTNRNLDLGLGNSWSGLILNRTERAVIESNVSLGNTISGIYLEDGTNDNIIRLNFSSGNLENGLGIHGDGNTVQGNILGTNRTGSQALSNGKNGIYIAGSRNKVGGSRNRPEEVNLVSGNLDNGIVLDAERNGTGNIVQGNLIGTDITGKFDIRNRYAGIFVSGTNHQIGGRQSQSLGNLISGNGREGVVIGRGIQSGQNHIQGNLIGTDITSQSALPNGSHGVSLWDGVFLNEVGGSSVDLGNIVAYNRAIGLAKWDAGESNRFQNNTVHDNGDVGIQTTANTLLVDNQVYHNFYNRINFAASELKIDQTLSPQGDTDTYYIFRACAICELAVPAQRTLIVRAGSILRFDYGRPLIVTGTLQVTGAPTLPTRLTGPKNNSRIGDWQGIRFEPGSNGQIDRAEISFALTGIQTKGAVEIRNSQIVANDTGITVSAPGTLRLEHNAIATNINKDLVNNTSVTIAAHDTWWGIATGPQSNKVSLTSVDTTDWKTTEEDNDFWHQAIPLLSGSHTFRISRHNDVDWYRVPIYANDSKLSIRLSQLKADYDVFLFGPLDATRETDAEDIGPRMMRIGDVVDTSNAQAIPRMMRIDQVFSDDIAEGVTGQLLSASTRAGAADESIDFYIGDQPGWYYILVAGNNGAFDASAPYRLSVATVSGSAPTESNKDLSFPSLQSTYVSKTLILFNSKQFATRFDQLNANRVQAKLQQLAQSPLVEGYLVDLGSIEPLAQLYQLWHNSPTSVFAANQLAQGIKQYLATIRSSFPNLEYIVLVGDDDILPHYRIPDETVIANERDFDSLTIATSPVGTAMHSGYYLSDDFYADFQPRLWRGRNLFIPQYALGRLVKNPNEIVQLIDSFLAHPNINVSEAVVTGYDFLKDQAKAITATLPSTIKIRTLVNDFWSTSDLKNIWFNSPTQLTFLNAHFTHQNATAANLDTADLFLPQHVFDGLKIGSESLVYSVGCHSGLCVPNNQNVTPRPVGSNDFCEAIASKGVAQIANLGYAYGDRDVVSYSEQLSVLFVRGLREKLSIGPALANAKAAYYQSSGVNGFGPYDEKIMAITTLYGLPMQALVMPVTSELDRAAKAEADACPISALSAEGFNGQKFSMQCTFSPSQWSTSQGSYFSPLGNKDSIEIEAGYPIQPKQIVDISPQAVQVASPLRAHGVFFEGGNYTTFSNFNPVIANLITDRIRSLVEQPFRFSSWYPAGWETINTVRSAQGLNQKLILMPGQYRTRSSTTGDMRVFSTMKYTLYYTTYRDKRAPNIVSTSSKSLVNRTTITTEVTDFSGVNRVAIAYTFGDGQWRVVEMSRTSQNTNLWTADLPFAMPSNLEYFTQAVDSAGNVASADNKGDYYPIRFTAWLYLPIVSR